MHVAYCYLWVYVGTNCSEDRCPFFLLPGASGEQLVQCFLGERCQECRRVATFRDRPSIRATHTHTDPRPPCIGCMAPSSSSAHAGPCSLTIHWAAPVPICPASPPPLALRPHLSASASASLLFLSLPVAATSRHLRLPPSVQQCRQSFPFNPSTRESGQVTIVAPISFRSLLHPTTKTTTRISTSIYTFV